ncbi:MAG: hypothetical protein M1835_007832 [Candelina submexicana]|nr:MAG: hypothetical protein M1835_007832 [Candelina submexicana]
MLFSRYLGGLAGGLLLASSVTAAPADSKGVSQDEDFFRRRAIEARAGDNKKVSQDEDFFVRRELTNRALTIDPNNKNGRQPWPDNTLTYCFANDDSKDKLAELVKEGFEEWKKAGDIHHLKIKKEDHCDTKKHLVITYVKGQMRTTVGFLSGDTTMKFDPDLKGYGDKKINMAHELGHAFGFFHEQQRPDAKNHVKFECENLKDYEDILKANNGNKETVKRLCENHFEATTEGFSARDFAPLTDMGLDESGDFNMDSIMRYNSEMGGKRALKIGPRKSVLTDLNGKDLKDIKKVDGKDVDRLNRIYH